MDHLAELSRALLDLEKEPRGPEAIDTAFRMAHSIKGMAASLDYQVISAVAHRLEDAMEAYRTAGRVDDPGLRVMFRGLEGLEGMVQHVREHGQEPEEDPSLLAALVVEPVQAETPGEQPKKVRGRR